ncbi:SMI1/KNR4 family protein [Rugosimonospora africana]|uniref:Knr4/Smi1-like domain-containing protein n=1 Tax=Rugosimonospora africana TaxID=556532 RepID=A0A8J3QZP3_9ACTN|nr:SMI1/KNR4 family protein [Rugosimonospora africana]GIH19863.1 hypothetical protein Raf01_80350 [Rugosimonospora africana]
MTDLRALIGELASALAGTSVAVLQARYHRGGSSLHTFDAAGRPAFADTGLALHAALPALDEALRPAGEARPLVVELVRDGAGHAELGYTFDLPTVAPARLILDPGYRSRRHSASPSPAPAGVAVTDRPTHPRVLATVRALVAEFAHEYERKTGRAPRLGAGHSEKDIRAAEAAMGLRLPEDLRALYRTVSSDEEYGLLGAGALLHPTVWRLRLASGSPVAIGTLADLPVLSHLDLSAADVKDLRRLTELPGLRVLELNLAQWRELRECGALPPRLAAAALNGFAGLREVDEWADWLREAAGQG